MDVIASSGLAQLRQISVPGGFKWLHTAHTLPKVSPQFIQRIAPGGFSVPQAGQITSSRGESNLVPQLAQTRLPSESCSNLAAPQDGHEIGLSVDMVIIPFEGRSSSIPYSMSNSFATQPVVMRIDL